MSGVALSPAGRQAADVPGLERAASLFRSVPDFPAAGVVFQDITPVLADPAALRAVVEAMIAPFEGAYDAVAGLDARGFLLAGFAAALTGTGVIPLRKAGKLPVSVAHVDYALEYGAASLEAPPELAVPGLRVLILDDVLATGGTLAAARELAERCGAKVAGSAVVLEVEGLGGRERCSDALTLFSA
ncbi:adenine phosphoribosyltransferase [Micrococcus porci]|uniref:adenine phosphoribosyltransferase n=1 Tax=Micrococcus porci TaxID=2856555 RepID=UPI003CE68C32